METSYHCNEIPNLSRVITLTTYKKIEAAILSDLMISIFRVNARLLEQGDHLVAPLQLTSARWQVLGAVALAATPLSTPQIAEAMGITRQGAQKQLNRMLAEGLFAVQVNPRHLRSPLYALTEQGRDKFEQAMRLQSAWADNLAEGLSLTELEDALRLMNTLYTRLNLPLPTQGV
jgi:DNA-binding MarR family transcriptional regulator